LPPDAPSVVTDTVVLVTIAVFSTLVVVHMFAILYNESAESRSVSTMAALSSAYAAFGYVQLLFRWAGGSVVLLSTFGVRFHPVYYVMWSHSAPAMVMLLHQKAARSHKNETLLRKHVRDTTIVMLAGLVTTVRLPPSLDGLRWTWRVLWLSVAALAFVSVCRYNVASVPRYLGLPRSTYKLALIRCSMTISWCCFPIAWAIGQAELVVHIQGFDSEVPLFAIADMFSKFIGAFMLMHAQYADERALFRATAKAQALETFARSMGHDLRTPLQSLVFVHHQASGMVGRLEELLLKLPANTTEASALLQVHRQLASQQQKGVLCTRMLSCIVGNLWDLHAMSHGVGATVPSASEEFDMSTQLVDLMDLLRTAPIRHENDCKLVERLDPSVPKLVRGDISRLLRTLLNLLINAMKFTKKGTVTFTTKVVAPSEGYSLPRMSATEGQALLESHASLDASLTSSRVLLQSKQPTSPPSSPKQPAPPLSAPPSPQLPASHTCPTVGPLGDPSAAVAAIGAGAVAPCQPPEHPRVRIRFEVSDTGSGMTAEQMSSALQFKAEADAPSLHEKRTDSRDGMGLGLAICVRSIESMGGKLQISSQVDKGTTCRFEIDFPVLVHQPSPLRPAKPAAAGSCNGTSTSASINGKGPQSALQVMVVDDVLNILEGASEVIRMLGHHVLCTAADGHEALEKLKEYASRLDVVFLDVRLPVMFGDSVTRQYRAWEALERPNAPKLAIYACTGDVSANDVFAHLSCGFSGTLAKPLYPRVYQAILSRDPKRIHAVLLQDARASEPGVGL